MDSYVHLPVYCDLGLTQWRADTALFCDCPYFKLARRPLSCNLQFCFPLPPQAAAAQRFREQQENERRRRLEEMRLRDADRRSQVEERKRIIQQAEQDRREAVLRKNIVSNGRISLLVCVNDGVSRRRTCIELGDDLYWEGVVSCTNW